MITQLVPGDPCLRVVAALALPAAAVARAWLTHRTAVVRERGRNRRLDAAIGGTAPDQRPEILRAVGELEGAVRPAPAARCPEDETEAPAPPASVLTRRRHGPRSAGPEGPGGAETG